MHDSRAKAGAPQSVELATLLADPASVPISQIPAAIGELERTKAVLWSRLAMPKSETNAVEDRLIDVREAAQRLGMSVDWLYRHADRLPFTCRQGRRTLRFSLTRIDRYLASHGSLDSRHRDI